MLATDGLGERLAGAVRDAAGPDCDGDAASTSSIRASSLVVHAACPADADIHEGYGSGICRFPGAMVSFLDPH